MSNLKRRIHALEASMNNDRQQIRHLSRWVNKYVQTWKFILPGVVISFGVGFLMSYRKSLLVVTDTFLRLGAKAYRVKNHVTTLLTLL